MDIIKGIIEILYEEGLAIEYNDKDLDLRDYIADSIQFISFIVAVENKFNIEVPDECLKYDSISSVYSFAEMIKSCIEENNEAYND